MIKHKKRFPSWISLIYRNSLYLSIENKIHRTFLYKLNVLVVLTLVCLVKNKRWCKTYLNHCRYEFFTFSKRFNIKSKDTQTLFTDFISGTKSSSGILSMFISRSTTFVEQSYSLKQSMTRSCQFSGLTKYGVWQLTAVKLFWWVLEKKNVFVPALCQNKHSYIFIWSDGERLMMKMLDKKWRDHIRIYLLFEEDDVL